MKSGKSDLKKEFNYRLVRFSVNVISFSKELQKARELWSVSDQLIRSATSVGANVLEARGSSSKRDYCKFFEIALKSANETLYWLVVIREYDNSFKKRIAPLEDEVKELSKILASSVMTMKKKS